MLTKLAAFVKNSSGSRDRRSQPPPDVRTPPPSTLLNNIESKKPGFFARRRSQRMSCPPKPRGAHDVAFALHEKLLASDHGSTTDDGDRPVSMGWSDRDSTPSRPERASMPVRSRRNTYGNEAKIPPFERVSTPPQSRQQKYLSMSTLPLLQALDKQLEPYIVRAPEERNTRVLANNGKWRSLFTQCYF